MNLSFAKDSKLFSKVVEELRREKAELSEANIKARYESYLQNGKEGGKEGETVPEKHEEVVVETPKRSRKPKND